MNTHISVSVHCTGLGNHPELGYLRVGDHTEVKLKQLAVGFGCP